MVGDSDDWPFEDPRNCATFTTRQVIYSGKPVLLVTHDADDGYWQFLDGGDVTAADALIVALHEVVDRDPTLRELADLPLGWRALRDFPGGQWRRELKPPDPAEDE